MLEEEILCSPNLHPLNSFRPSSHRRGLGLVLLILESPRDLSSDLWHWSR